MKKPAHPRSPHWPLVEKLHLEKEPACRVCKRKDHVQVHHVQPFHLHPELELDPDNLVTLCEGADTDDHHLWFGHLGDFHCINPDVRQWCEKAENRKPV